MRTPTWPFFFLLLLFNCFVLAQENVKLDSLITISQSQKDGQEKFVTLEAIYNLMLYSNPEKAKKYALLSLALAKKIDYKKGIGDSYYNIGVYFNSIGETDSTRYYYQKAQQQYKLTNDIRGQTAVTHGLAILFFAESEYNKAIDLVDQNIDIQSNPNTLDSSRLASSYDLKSFIHVQKGNYRIALIQALKALKIYDHLDEPIRKADAMATLGEIEFNLGNITESLKYLKESLGIYKENNDTFYEAEMLMTIADTYIEIKEQDKALEYLDESLKLSKEIQSPSIEAMILGSYANIYMEQKQFGKALNYLKRALVILRKADRPNIMGEAWMSLSIVHKNLQKPQLSMKYLDSTINLAKKIEDKDLLKRAYFDQSELFSGQQNFEEALNSFKAFNRLTDSLFNAKKSQQIEELRTIYDTEKKEQQITLQEKEITVLEQQASINNLQKLLLGIGLLLSLIGFYAIRQKLKRNKLEKEKVDAELAFKKKELTTHALHLAKKNEVLEGLKQKAQELKEKEESKNGYQQLIRTINFDLQDDNNWENFSRYFEEVHKDFNSNVKSKYPEVTPNELRLLALLKMNLSSKEIANILNISPEGIKKARYRLRKKLDITTEDSLQDLVLSL